MVGKIKKKPPYEVIAELLAEVVKLVFEETGHDFSDYKKNTLIRRVHRRMQLVEESDPYDYLALLRDDGEERSALFEELLIDVTRFFRNTSSFEVLGEQIIPEILSDRAKEDTIRVWSPGCSTGKEVYSVAILLQEHLEELEIPPAIELFGSDINEEALATARAGIYDAGIVEQVGEERLERFFNVQSDGSCQVDAQLREICRFSLHNAISDPPYSNIDLICCRNLLIYMSAELQDRLIPVLHYSLRENGYLFLGSSETLTDHDHLFSPIDRKHRLWQRRNYQQPYGAYIDLPFSSTSSKRTFARKSESGPDVEERMRSALLERHAPGSVVVGPGGEILCSNGAAADYLGLRDGRFHNHVVQLARPGLRVALRAAIKEVRATAQAVTRQNLSIQTDEGIQPVRLVVEPLSGEQAEGTELLLVLFFEDHAALKSEDFEVSGPDEETESLIAHLERELENTRGDLEHTVQELETSNEELKSSNEELLSMNEELHSANEELKVSNDEVEDTNRALAHAKADLENLLESSRIATLFLDEQGLVQWFSPAVKQIYHLRDRDVGRPLSEITDSAVEMPSLPELGALKESPEPLEAHVSTTQGRRFLRRIQPYVDENGPTGGMVVSFLDITELKGVQEQLRGRTAELELSKRQLQESMRRAEAASRTKSEFLANMSHEIRTPMTAILGYAQVLLEHLEDPDDRQCVQTIIRNGDFLLEIINDILDLSKVEAGKLQVEPTEVVPAKLVTEVASLMQPRAREKRLSLTVEFENELPEKIETDPRRVRQILINLVGNALKFTDQGSVRIRVSCDWLAQQVEFSVIDTGIGISSDHYEELFEPFMQHDTSGTREYGGTGLGLTICARLADALGGRIDVSSVRDEGSTFCLTIPTGDLEEVRSVQPDQDLKIPSATELDSDIQIRGRILVVDDRQEICYLARHFIEDAGGTTASAENGEEALQKVAEAESLGRPFDLIVMDIQMPIMDGVEATRTLRKRGFTKPILALTAGAMREDRDRCLEAGCDDHISKPIDASRFISIIASHIETPSTDENVAANDSFNGSAGDKKPAETTDILLVEDNVDVRKILCTLIEAWGFGVVACPDGATALERAADLKPNVVLMDIGLPDVSGIEVCTQLRASDTFDDTYFIALSGLGSNEDKERSFDAGFDHFVTKPPNPDELRDVLLAAVK